MFCGGMPEANDRPVDSKGLLLADTRRMDYVLKQRGRSVSELCWKRQSFCFGRCWADRVILTSRFLSQVSLIATDHDAIAYRHMPLLVLCKGTYSIP